MYFNKGMGVTEALILLVSRTTRQGVSNSWNNNYSKPKEMGGWKVIFEEVIVL